mgnify:CR=1 FL=1
MDTDALSALVIGLGGLFVLTVAWINPRNILRNPIERGAIMCVGFMAGIIPTIILLGIL